MVTCPKCNKTSGDDWSQCGKSCPMPMSPKHKTKLAELKRMAADSIRGLWGKDKP